LKRKKVKKGIKRILNDKIKSKIELKDPEEFH